MSAQKEFLLTVDKAASERRASRSGPCRGEARTGQQARRRARGRAHTSERLRKAEGDVAWLRSKNEQLIAQSNPDELVASREPGV